MNSIIETILIILIIANLIILGSTKKIKRSINIFAIESTLIGILVLLFHNQNLQMKFIFLIVITILIKSILIPWLLLRSTTDLSLNTTTEPFIGYSSSVIAGMIALAISLWLGTNLSFPIKTDFRLVIPVAFYMIFVGLFLMVTRRKAINQVIGYLILENGIYIFGAFLVTIVAFLVELGILLDLVGAVFIMAIALFHINENFEHIDISRLSNLKD